MELLRLVGQNVRRLRRSRGLSQEQLAEQAEASQQYVSDLERGRCNATLSSLEKLAQALSAAPWELLKPDSPSSD